MGQRLIIESLEVRTASATATYSFGPGVNAVTGPLGSGKSSMLELIKYGLGGSAKVMPAVRDNVELIVLRVQVGRDRWQLTRRLRDPLVDVVDLITDEPLGTWATTNRQNMRLLKIELQRALGLPTDWRVPTSRRKPTDKTMPIGFGDVYRYLYLDQEGIDSSVIRHTDNNLNNKRIAVFELLYGLASMRSVELARLRGERIEEAAAQRRKAAAVAQFLEDLGEPDVQAIASSRARLAEQVLQAGDRLEDARNAASQNLVPRSSIALVSETRSRLEDATSRRDALQASIDEARGVAAQLQIEESRLKRATTFSESVSGFEFVQCPRCMQSVAEERFEADACNLCGQHQEPADDQLAVVRAAAKVLREQKQETTELLALDEAKLAELMADVDDLSTALYEGMARLVETDEPVTRPTILAVEEAVSDLVRLQSEEARLVDAMARWSTHVALLRDADEIETEARRLAAEESTLRLELSEHSTRIDELSDLFEEILGSLNDPWFSEAHVDKSDYLPVVDGEKFDMLSVAGARKTLVNLAYHLANLSMSISERTDMLLPTLLIVDSPRKNVGNSALDRSVVEAIYSRLRTLQAASPDQFQIIFADNDMPPSASEWVTSHIALDYEHPLVPGVTHRGEEEEPIGDAATEIE